MLFRSYIQKFNRKIIVVKYGGSAMSDEELQRNVIKDVTLLKLVGFKPIIVHGGGKEISRWVGKVGWTPDNSPSLFAKVLIPDEGNIPNWEQPESTNGYAAGDKVQHKGETWESLIDGNVWEPGEIGTENQWKKVR